MNLNFRWLGLSQLNFIKPIAMYLPICHLYSEALSTHNFHWVLARVQHHLDMLTSDKENVKLWERRLNIAMQVQHN